MGHHHAEADIAAAFDNLDTDGDGHVNRAAYLAAVRAFIGTGDSPLAVMYGAGESVVNAPA
jgi:hypothetical protein